MRGKDACVFIAHLFHTNKIFRTIFGFVATMAAMAALPMCARVQYFTKARECSDNRISCTTFGFVTTMAAMVALPMCAGVPTDNSACSKNGRDRSVYGETNALVQKDNGQNLSVYRETCALVRKDKHNCTVRQTLRERQVLRAGRARGSRQVRYNWATSLTAVF